MHNEKRNLLFVCIGIFILISSIAAYKKIQGTAGIGSGKIILVDAGHGGSDPGKVGINNVLEKDINLQIAKLVSGYLRANGYTVILSRTSDCMLSAPDAINKKTSDLNARIALMEQAHADLAISIHQNSYPEPSVRGAQCFYYQGSEKGQSIAENIQNALVKLVDPDNHRLAKANDSYYIMKNSPCPVVIVECGFLSNYEEAELLPDEEYQKKIAFAIASGINHFYQH